MEPTGNNKIKTIYYRYLWWPWQLFLLSAAVLFLLFGFAVFIYAYRLEDPFSFIITFFSSNLIILISAVMILAFGIRIVTVLRTGVKERKRSDMDEEE